MSNSSRSSSLSESSIETNASISSSEFMTANSDESNSEILPFADNIEPLASPDEIAEYEAAVAEEQQVEDMLQDRFDARVDVTSWCECGHCSLDLVVNPQECRCCMELEQCRGKMNQFEVDERKCILDHPGFNEVCLNEFVLQAASLGLKTKGHRSYATVFRDGQKTREEFFRAVSYRQLVRLVWDFTGSSRHFRVIRCIGRNLLVL
ncbi:uncharacterized protein LOC124446177 [Xenia sp. Carnegie-2017]|uniref:uncharacterized protein LOC124446177 n=1 Tax=Xenia sp. Carnegie-2017 TaxID=2897299 RepID=UPI001F035F68|nr:uncharacterized protein LOC124446177 [Xenia sp. Carnegie-2017]